MVSKSASYVPERGNAVRISFNPQTGHEQSGRRPALVLTPSAYYGKVGLAIFCPSTNKAKGYPFEVPIPEGLSVTGVILADQVKSLDWQSRNAEYICSLPNETVSQVLKLIDALLHDTT